MQMFPSSLKRELKDCWGCQVCAAYFTFMKESSGFGSSPDWMAVFSFSSVDPVSCQQDSVAAGQFRKRYLKIFNEQLLGPELED